MTMRPDPCLARALDRGEAATEDVTRVHAQLAWIHRVRVRVRVRARARVRVRDGLGLGFGVRVRPWLAECGCEEPTA